MKSPKSVPTSPPLALRPSNAATALGISPRKLWELTAAGEIPHVRLGRVVLYPASALAAWLEANSQGGKGGGAA